MQYLVQPAKAVVSDERKADQKALDKALMAAVTKTPYMKEYLASRFSLSNGVYPHAIKF
jgi:large subunit ribosomal protein L6e